MNVHQHIASDLAASDTDQQRTLPIFQEVAKTAPGQAVTIEAGFFDVHQGIEIIQFAGTNDYIGRGA